MGLNSGDLWKKSSPTFADVNETFLSDHSGATLGVHFHLLPDAVLLGICVTHVKPWCKSRFRERERFVPLPGLLAKRPERLVQSIAVPAVKFCFHFQPSKSWSDYGLRPLTFSFSLLCPWDSFSVVFIEKTKSSFSPQIARFKLSGS